MQKRLIVPGIFLTGFGVVCVQTFSILAPPFFKYLVASHSLGHALRTSLFWVLVELCVPLAGALAGAFIADWIHIRRRGVQ